MANRERIDPQEIIPPIIEGMGRNAVHRYQAAQLNTMTYEKWLHWLMTLAQTSFTWTGLPDCIDDRFLEYALLQSYGGDVGASMVAFFDMIPGLGSYAVMPAVIKGTPDIYMNPREIRCTPPNMSRSVDRMVDRINGNEDAAIGYDNLRRVSVIGILEDYARRLAEFDRLIDINLAAQSTPYVLTVNEQSVKSGLNFYAQVTGHEPVVVKYGKLDEVAPLEVMNTQAPYVIDKLMADKRRLQHEVLTLLGINNSNIDKRERLITSEAESNDEEIILMRFSRLAARGQFANAINRIFGLSVDVKYTPELAAPPSDPASSPNPDLMTEDDNELQGSFSVSD